MQLRVVFVVWMACCAMALGQARAQSADALKKAQAAFDQAQLDYLADKYDEAARGFEDAYTARPFPQFLYNAGASYHMKGKKASDPAAYAKAIEFYRKYLDADKTASDHAKVEKAIATLEAEIVRLKAAAAAPATPATPTAPADPNAAAPATTPAAPATPEVAAAEVKRSLVVIESDPSNATIYLDDKRKGAFGTTPWSGTLDGEHRVIIEKRGYVVIDRPVSPDPNKLFVLAFAMAPASYLGWVEISSNVPGADIYIDDKAVGAIGKTPLAQNLSKGKHTFWISAEGYDEVRQEVEVVPNEVTTIKAQLKGAPVGRLNITGAGIEDATIELDGKVLCERGPCLKSIAQGDHTVTVSRPGFKPYHKTITVQAKTETQVRVTLAPVPGRGDAIVAGILAAGFAGGGVFLGLQANKYHDDLRKEIDAGAPPPDSNDPRFTKGKVFAIAADAAFVAAGVTALTAIYYTFRDKGTPSSGLIDVRAISLRPDLGPGYAGLGMGVSW
jgi:hypothetical protein